MTMMFKVPGHSSSAWGAAGALVASLCCLGLPALVSLFAALGMGFLLRDDLLRPALLVFLSIYGIGLVLGWRQHRRVSIVLVGLLAAVGNFVFIFVVYSSLFAYTAVASLVAISVWDLIERRRSLAG